MMVIVCIVVVSWIAQRTSSSVWSSSMPGNRFFGQAGDELEQGWGRHDPDKHTLNGALCNARE